MVRVIVALGSVLVLAACTSFDAGDRRMATQDEYALGAQNCEVVDGVAVARGDLTNHAGDAKEFGVIVRFLDGDVDLGRPQSDELDAPIADGETWSWQVTLDVDHDPAELRCVVIQVVVGDNVSRD